MRIRRHIHAYDLSFGASRGYHDDSMNRQPPNLANSSRRGPGPRALPGSNAGPGHITEPSVDARPRARPRGRSTGAWLRDGAATTYLTAIMWFTILFLLIPLNVFSGATETSSLGQANPLTRAIKLGLMGLSLFVMWRRRSLSWLVLRQANFFFLAFLIVVPVSLLWSIDPGATIARYVSMLSIVAVCFGFVVMSWHPKRFQQVLRPLLMVVLVASIIFGIIRPDLAIETGDRMELANAWKGLTSQKNEFGMLGAFGFILWLHAWLSREATWWVAVGCCGVSFLAVLLSRSSTSFLSTTFASVLMVMLLRSPQNLRRYMPYIVGTFAVMVVIYAVAVLNLVPGLDIILSPFTALTGKDLTFSNRSEIWKIVKEHVELSPWIGSGYGAYWTGLPSSPSAVFLTRMYFYPTESHNGYLEIVNDLGFVGLTVLLGFLFVYVRQSLQLMKLDRAQGVLLLCFFFQQAMANLSESSWLCINVSFAFIVMTLATFTLSRTLLEHRFRRHFAARAAAVQ